MAPQVIEIDDPDDRRLADYRHLVEPDGRRRLDRDDVFVAEGVVPVQRLLESDHSVRSVLVTEQKRQRLADVLGGLDAPVYVAPKRILADVVGFQLHRGVLAAAARRDPPELASILSTATRLALLEGLNDPENLGAIARSARAFGIDAIVADPTCIDAYYRRVVRVSMGEILFLPVARPTAWPAAIHQVRDAGFEVWAMTPARDATSLWDRPVPNRVAVMFGAEGPGLTREAIEAADRRVAIPIASDVDSLNVGAAAAVTFAELARRPPHDPAAGAI